jgi:hypothetical protein
MITAYIDYKSVYDVLIGSEIIFIYAKTLEFKSKVEIQVQGKTYGQEKT